MLYLFCILYLFNDMYLLVEQSLPLYPAAHSQVNVFTPSTQVPPLAHGPFRQSSISFRENRSVKYLLLIYMTSALSYFSKCQSQRLEWRIARYYMTNWNTRIEKMYL